MDGWMGGVGGWMGVDGWMWIDEQMVDGWMD